MSIRVSIRKILVYPMCLFGLSTVFGIPGNTITVLVSLRSVPNSSSYVYVVFFPGTTNFGACSCATVIHCESLTAIDIIMMPVPFECATIVILLPCIVQMMGYESLNTTRMCTHYSIPRPKHIYDCAML